MSKEALKSFKKMIHRLKKNTQMMILTNTVFIRSILKKLVETSMTEGVDIICSINFFEKDKKYQFFNQREKIIFQHSPSPVRKT